MKTILFIPLFLMMLGIVSAQDSNTSNNQRPLKNINLNVFGGDASIFSLNYEQLFPTGESVLFTYKLGIGYNEEFDLHLFGPSNPESYLTLPHHVSFNFGKTRHFFELGFGGTIILGETEENYIAYPFIGYRLQPLKFKRIKLRMLISYPITGKPGDILFFPIGLNIGYCF